MATTTQKLVFFRHGDDILYVFSGTSFYTLNSAGTAVEEGPEDIKSVWGIEGPIDAGVRHGDTWYLFKGDQYYTLDSSSSRVVGGAKPISDWGCGSEPIDAALYHTNSRTYLFRGDGYYRIASGRIGCDAGYPLKNAVEWGVERVDSGLRWRGCTYLFYRDVYARLNRGSAKPDPGYPRRIYDDWGIGTKPSKAALAAGHAMVGGGAAGGAGATSADASSDLVSGFLAPVPSKRIFHRHSNDRVYVFQGVHYYRLEEDEKSYELDYPMSTSKVWGMTGGWIDSAFVWDGYTWFTRGANAYRYSGSKTIDVGPVPLVEKFGVAGPIDAAVNYEGALYFFKGTEVYKLNATATAPAADYPKPLSTAFPGVEGPIDSAITSDSQLGLLKGENMIFMTPGLDAVDRTVNASEYWGVDDDSPTFFDPKPLQEGGRLVFYRHIDSRLYVFRGKAVWKLTVDGSKPLPGYPRSIEREFGIKGPITAAFVWDDKCYFVVGPRYYRLTDPKEGPDVGYPKSMKRYWGVEHIDAAVTIDGQAVFFAGSSVYRINSHTSSPEYGYPKPISAEFPTTLKDLDSAVVWNDKVYFFKGKDHVCACDTDGKKIDTQLKSTASVFGVSAGMTSDGLSHTSKVAAWWMRR